MRIDKHNYYLNIAEAVSKRGTCLRRNYGSVIVKNDEIIATGYTGAPRSAKNCSDMNFCLREKNKILPGQNYEMCRSVHAEANSIISASRKNMIDSTLYLVGVDFKTGYVISTAESCLMCQRLIINSGIKETVVRKNNTTYKINKTSEFIKNLS